MKLQFKDILPSPYRDMVRNPLKEATIQKLVISVNNTGFWDNVVVRPSPTAEGKYELAYGHHRLEAAKRAGLTEADFIVRNFDESKMIKVKHKENDPSYGFSAPSMLESVRAVVYALAKGTVKPFEISKDTKKSSIRYAPSFIQGNDAGNPRMAYTAFSVADFLDETEMRGGGTKQANAAVRAALEALALIEQKELSEASLKELPLDGGKNGVGLIQKLKTVTEQRTSRIALAAAQKALAEVDADRRATEQAERDKLAEINRREAEAHREEDEAEALRLSEEGKRRAAQAEARAVAFKATRAALDARVQEAKEREEAARKVDKDLPTRHAVSTLLFKLNTVISEKSSFREELKSLARNKTVTQAERENVRQALLKVSNWYDEQALAFRPVAQVDVLKDMQQRETAKHKREER